MMENKASDLFAYHGEEVFLYSIYKFERRQAK